MNKIELLCKLNWSSCQSVVAGVRTAIEKQENLIPWAPRDRADLCAICTRLLALTKFGEGGVPNFVKINCRNGLIFAPIYSFLWVVNFRSQLPPFAST